jgi:hypothetical protein
VQVTGKGFFYLSYLKKQNQLQVLLVVEGAKRTNA